MVRQFPGTQLKYLFETLHVIKLPVSVTFSNTEFLKILSHFENHLLHIFFKFELLKVSKVYNLMYEPSLHVLHSLLFILFLFIYWVHGPYSLLVRDVM